MFKKVRRNFIIVAVSSVSLILIIVNVVINVLNINRQVRSSDEIISIIEREQKPKPTNYDILEAADPKVGDSRYFISYSNDDMSEIKFNFEHVDTSIVTESTAVSYTKDIVNSKQERGYKDVYRFHLSKEEGKNKIVFLDCRRSIDNFNIYFQITFFSSLGALIIYFLIIFFGSKFILKPVKESYEKQNRFITNASHELKTPLTIISANNELIEMKSGENEYSKSINKQINRMNIMIKDLISLSKLNEGRDIAFKQINISKLLNEELCDFESVCFESHLKLIKNIKEDIYIIGNEEFVKQIFLIILDNARKYSHSWIHITLEMNKNNVIFTQKNDSQNNIHGDLIKYTERFYRNEHIRTKIEGSGIGLSMLYELVNKLNAKMKIYGENSIFNIEITFTNKNKIK